VIVQNYNCIIPERHIDDTATIIPSACLCAIPLLADFNAGVLQRFTTFFIRSTSVVELGQFLRHHIGHHQGDQYCVVTENLHYLSTLFI
jgi:hypothetical protein